MVVASAANVVKAVVRVTVMIPIGRRRFGGDARNLAEPRTTQRKVKYTAPDRHNRGFFISLYSW